jgi:membrane associated rhomboid family serine protease
VLYIIFVLLVLAGFAFYVMSPEERVRALRNGRAALGHAREAAIEDLHRREPFRDALRERTPWALVTPGLIGLNFLVFFSMAFDEGALADPQTLISWGGNFGPLTTNGEWWRLVTATFLHAGFFQLLFTTVAILQMGLLLERLLGPFTVGSVYVGAGILSNVVTLSKSPVDVTSGPAGAVFGLYGLLVASVMWGVIHRSPLTIPLKTLKRLAPATVLFLLYAVGAYGIGAPQLTGLIVGVICGLVVSKGVSECKPPVRRVAATAAATLVLAVVTAVPLRGVTDARPEIERLIAVEDRTAGAYQKAVSNFRNGRMSAGELAKLIDQSIVPELQEVRTRLTSLEGVPREQQPMVAGAEEYLRLRDESWRIRTEGLHKSNLKTLSKAEKPEREALEALQKLRPPVETAPPPEEKTDEKQEERTGKKKK